MEKCLVCCCGSIMFNIYDKTVKCGECGKKKELPGTSFRGQLQPFFVNAGDANGEAKKEKDETKETG